MKRAEEIGHVILAERDVAHSEKSIKPDKTGYRRVVRKLCFAEQLLACCAQICA